MTKTSACLLAFMVMGLACSYSTREGKQAVVAQQDDLLDQAAFQMKCARAGLTVTRISNDITAGVEGCGKRLLYKYVGGVGWVANTKT